MHPARTSPMPIEASREGGSLPSSVAVPGSAPPPQRPWRNRKPSNNMRRMQGAHWTDGIVSPRHRCRMGAYRSAWARPHGGHGLPPGKRFDRHVTPSSMIGPSCGARSRYLSSTIRLRHPWSPPSAVIAASSLLRIARSILAISRRATRRSEGASGRAQKQFNRWLQLDEAERTPSRLVDMLGFDYFTLHAFRAATITGGFRLPPTAAAASERETALRDYWHLSERIENILSVAGEEKQMSRRAEMNMELARLRADRDAARDRL